jgi:hypothetical protein
MLSDASMQRDDLLDASMQRDDWTKNMRTYITCLSQESHKGGTRGIISVHLC